jgi:hypothetical protein
MNSTKKFGFVAILILAGIICCTPFYNYNKARYLYSEKQYEGALNEINLAIKRNQQSIEYRKLTDKIIIDLLSSYGFPIIAYDYFLKVKFSNNYGLKSTKKEANPFYSIALLNAIKKKFTIPVVIHISDNFHKINKQCVTEKLDGMLKNICNNFPFSYRLYNYNDIDIDSLEYLSKPVFVNIILSDYKKNIIENKTIEIPSKYKVFKKVINKERIYLEFYLNNLNKTKASLIRNYVTEKLNTSMSYSESVFKEKELKKSLKRNQRQKNAVLRKLRSTPRNLKIVQIKDYFIKEVEYNISTNLKVNFEIIEIDRSTIWKANEWNLSKNCNFKKIENVHASDAKGKKNQKINERNIEKKLKMLKRDYCIEIVNRIKNDIIKIPYFQAKHFEKSGLLAQAWESYFIFLMIGNINSYEYLDARFFVEKNPLEFLLIN